MVVWLAILSRAIMADSGRLVKMEVDYSDSVDRLLPECQELAKVTVAVFRSRENTVRPHRAAMIRKQWRNFWRWRSKLDW